MKPLWFKMKRKGRRRDRKKVEVLCDFCGSNRYEGHDDSLSRLRLLNRRLSGKDLEGLSFADIKKLQTHLKESVLIVEEEKSKRKEAQWHLLKNKKERGHDEATMTSSSEKKQAQLLVQIEYERQRAESPESEFQRLWLWKERMSCRGLGDMTDSELGLLLCQMNLGLLRMTVDYIFSV